MKTYPVGTRVYVVSNTNDHNYTVGRAYVITEVDDDGTFKARDPDSGVVGNWLRWKDIDIVPPLGWDFCKGVLPPEVVTFLSAFQGIESIRIRDDIKTRILRKIPNLYDAIMEEAVRDGAAAAGGKMIEFPGLRAISGDKTDGGDSGGGSSDDSGSTPPREDR